MSSPFGSSLLVTGPEALLAQRVVADVKARALTAEPGADVNEINAADLEFSMLSEVVGGSLFSSHIVAIIDDVGACPASVVEQLVAVAADPSDELCLVLVHPGGNKGRGLIDKLKKAKVPVETVAQIKPWDLPKFVTDEARRRRVKLGPDAATELVSAVGHDLRALAAAVGQLADDSDSGEVTAELIKRYFAGRAEVTSFAVADAVLAGNASLAMERLRWALGTGAAPVLITSAMAGAFRGLARYLDAQGSRMSDYDLARQIGVPPFKIKEFSRVSRNWRSGGVAKAITLVAVGDAEVKGAATDADYALERMVLGVLRLRHR
ncbi:MAG: DNA polymerase III subunit delta [Tessaracoccus sp.]|uniref:DNA polymerase III subunit delta n=1 Tax=Tessaracoccus sp. TaxID=1971211 RepID=UPI001ED0FA43|nr:DNA polymerase III subunit delta [Tessaracoccus sp.]MBK7820582.1 DNA polymerase III subunit delta [Tessaracoccus sp.]